MMSIKFGEHVEVCRSIVDHSLVSKLEMLTFAELMNFYCLITLFFLSFIDP